MNGKKEYRAHYLAVRRALPPEHIAAWSRQISALILKDPLFAKAGVIMGYLAMAGEPNIDEVLKAALKMGKIVCVPAFTQQKGIMRAARLEQFDRLTTGAYGIRAVPNDAATIPAETIELILTPGLAFTPQGVRLGLGGGYYDRFLPSATQACRMGVLFECFFCRDLPSERHYAKVDYLAMEPRIIRCSVN